MRVRIGRLLITYTSLKTWTRLYAPPLKSRKTWAFWYYNSIDCRGLRVLGLEVALWR